LSTKFILWHYILDVQVIKSLITATKHRFGPIQREPTVEDGLGGPYIGKVAPDGESQSQYSAHADGDDKMGVDDEDGLTSVALVKGSSGSVMPLFTPSADWKPFTLAMWLDLDGNGKWDDPADLSDVYTHPNPRLTGFHWIIPVPTATVGKYFLRVRVYEGIRTSVSPDGPGGPGEVEDHEIEIKEASSSIAGFKFNDLDGDGQPDLGEPRLAGWTIWLDDNGDGKPEKTTTTDGLGEFSFGGLGAGKYTVGEVEQPGWKRTAPPDPGTYTTTIPSVSQPQVHVGWFGNTPAYDFGDAPEGGPYKYPTTHANNSARHKIMQRFYLGADADGEPEGLQSGDAQGDDNNNRDDEDGVKLPTTLIPGTKANITVTVTAAAPVDCYLDAWVDFHCDGDWRDPNEQIFAGWKLTALSNALSFDVPVDAVCDVSFARFRLSKNGGLSCDGEAPDGEVEDYAVEINPAGAQPPAPRPPMGHPKWSQPPVEIGRDGGIPIYSGWNEPSGEVEVESNLWFDCWNCPTQCYGDADCDGDVDLNDYAKWKGSYSSKYGDMNYDACADFDRDLDVDIDDVLHIWQQNYTGSNSLLQEPACPGKPVFRQVLADDWLCKDARPVTDIHWWCSFIGWTNQRRLPPVVPEGFHIGIWTNVAEGEDPQNPFSHPGSLIWENMCTNWTWRFAGYDLDPRTKEGEKEACFEFTHLLSQDEWFKPDLDAPGRGKIYWLSITPIYEEEMSSVEHPWGWKTRPHFFADDAVRIFQSENAVAGAPQGEMYPLSPPALGAQWVSGEPITWGGESWDLAFELTSNEPDPAKPGRPDLNGDGIVDFNDFLIMARWWLTPDP
jgi:hypothetical protein